MKKLLMMGLIFLMGVLVSGSAAGIRKGPSVEELEAKVREREQAFAKTLADRDLDAFTPFVAEDAVFFGRTPLRGRAAVKEGWKPYFQGAQAPFAWEPEHVFVAGSKDLALSTGPVHDPQGKRIGTFKSTWRLEKDGQWRVVLDSGCPECSCPEPPGSAGQ